MNITFTLPRPYRRLIWEILGYVLMQSITSAKQKIEKRNCKTLWLLGLIITFHRYNNKQVSIRVLTKGYCAPCILFLLLPQKASANMCTHMHFELRARCNVRTNEANRQTCIKHTCLYARTIKHPVSVTNNHKDINNSIGINSTNHTHVHHKCMSVTRLWLQNTTSVCMCVFHVLL